MIQFFVIYLTVTISGWFAINEILTEKCPARNQVFAALCDEQTANILTIKWIYYVTK